MIIGSWKIFALLSAFFAALTAIFGKIGVTGIDSNFATFIRTVVILIFISLMLIFGEFKFSTFKDLTPHQIAFLVLSGLCTGFSWLCYYRALQLGPASSVAPVDKLSVAFAILLAWIFLGEKMIMNTAVGGALIVVGFIIILLGTL